MSTQQLMTTSEASKVLRVSARHVARLVSAGTLQPAIVAPGGRGSFLFDAEHIRAVAAARGGEQLTTDTRA